MNTKLGPLTSVETVVAHDVPDPCSATLYSPCYLQEDRNVPGEEQEKLYTQGDEIDRPTFLLGDPDFPLSDKNTGADRTRLWVRHPAGRWMPRITNRDALPSEQHNIVLTNHDYPWMNRGYDGEQWLLAHLESYIGAHGGPKVIKIGSRYFMFLPATVGDIVALPNNKWTVMTSGLFVVYLWESEDGVHWTLRNMHRPAQNVALEYAFCYFGTPAPNARRTRAEGITSVCPLYVPPYVYISFQAWTPIAQKNGMLRIRVINGSPTGELQQWLKDDVWIDGPDGVLLPSFVDGGWNVGNPFAHIISQICAAPPGSDDPFMLVASPDGTYIETAYSRGNTLTDWRKAQMVPSRIPRFLDGTGYKGQCRDPWWTGEQFMLGTNDAGVLSGDLSKCGLTGCPTDDYRGIRIAGIECGIAAL